MSDIFALDLAGNKVAADQAARSPYVEAAGPGWFDRAPAAIGMGIARGGVLASRATSILSAAPVAAYESLTGQQGRYSDRWFRSVDEESQAAIDFWTPNAATTGAASNVLGGLAEMTLQLAATGGDPALLLASMETNPAVDLVNQGVDAETAVRVGLAQGAAGAVGFRLPILGKTLAGRLATGAAGNLAANTSAMAVSQVVLEQQGYSKAAAEFDPMNLEARMVDVLAGAAFGGIHHLGARGEPVPVNVAPEIRDAALSALNARHVADIAPGRPANIEALVAHNDATELAFEQLLRGEPVDVAKSGVQDAEFIGPPNPEMAVAEQAGQAMPTTEELQARGEQPDSIVDAARAQSEGWRVFALHEMDEDGGGGSVRELTIEEILNGPSTPDGMIMLPPEDIPAERAWSEQPTDRGTRDTFGDTGGQVRGLPIGRNESMLYFGSINGKDIPGEFGSRQEAQKAVERVLDTEPPVSQETRAWLGKSKAVDQLGRPQVLYRGSGKAEGTTLSAGGDGLIYLTESEEYAGAYAGSRGKTSGFVLKAEKPLTIQSLEDRPSRFAMELERAGVKDAQALVDALGLPESERVDFDSILHPQATISRALAPGSGKTAPLVAAIKAAGFDSIRYRERLHADGPGSEPHWSWAVWDRKALRPVDGVRETDVSRAKSGDLTPKEAAVEGRFAKYLGNNFDAAVERYSKLDDADGGKVLNTDTARELSPDYLKDRTLSAAVHEPSSWLIKRLYEKALRAEPRAGEENLVLFTAGGTGAGKSTAVKDSLGTVADRAQIVYDSNMSDAAKAITRIKQALDAGKHVKVAYVFRDPAEALTHGALTRAMRQEGEYGSGRTVPLAEHVNTHVGAREAIPEIAAHFAGDPRVEIAVIDNSRGKEKAAVVDLADLPQIDYTSTHERATQALEKEFKAGRISEQVYRGFRGEQAAAERVGAADGGQPEPQRGQGTADQVVERARAETEAVASNLDAAGLTEEAETLRGDYLKPPEITETPKAAPPPRAAITPEIKPEITGGLPPEDLFAVAPARDAAPAVDGPVAIGETGEVAPSAEKALTDADAAIEKAQQDAKGIEAAVACFLAKGVSA